MTDRPSGRVLLKTESELYGELAETLKRTRTAAAVREVELVLGQEGLSVRDKLESIRDIDAKSSLGSNLWQLKQKKNDTTVDDEQSLDAELAIRGLATAAIVRERRRNFVQQPRKSGIMRMLFRDRNRLARFAAETGTIDFRVFPPRLQMSRRVERYYHETLRPLAMALAEPLHQVTAHGWLWLSAFEYNLVVEFDSLCAKIVDLSQEANRTGERDPWAKFRRLELPFLICNFRPEYPEKILRSIDLVLSSSHDKRWPAKRVREDAAQILALDRGRLSLYATIQGLAITAARRWLPLEALIPRGLAGIVNTCTFDCSKDVQQTIDSIISQKSAELRRLRILSRESARYRAFLEFRQDGSVSTACLQRLIQLEGDGDDTLIDGRDMAGFTAAWADAFDKAAEGLFGREVNVAGAGSVRIFSADCFVEILDELRSIANKIARFAQVNSHARVTQAILSGRATSGSGHPLGSRSEQETILEIERYAQKLFSLGERLAMTLAGRVQVEAMPLRPEPVQLGDILAGRVVLPWGDSCLAGGQYLRHRTIAEAVFHLTQLTWTGAWFLCERRIRGQVEAEQSVAEGARSVLALLSRIMHPCAFEKILHEEGQRKGVQG